MPADRTTRADRTTPENRKTRPVVLTDFDGVWTDVTGQARAVDEARLPALVETGGVPPAVAEACLEAVEAALDAAPGAHGWRWEGRVTAFADEDPFIRHTTLLSTIALLAADGQPDCVRVRDALAARGVHDLTAFGSEVFLAASHAYVAAAGHTLLPGAVEVLHALLEVADVVFCSNFTTAAVADTWARHGLRSEDADDGADDGADGGATPGLRIRGLARKQALTGPARLVPFGGRPVAVDRGHYEAILLAERPTVVVGDVFSLDLSLPLVLRAESALPGLRALLARTAHTPEWALELRADGLATLDDLGTLPALVLG